LKAAVCSAAGAGGKIDALIDRRDNQDVIWRKL